MALALPYAALMRLSGYPVPDGASAEPAATIGGALFADLAEHEREELLAYLAWYRARRGARTEAPGAG